MSCDGDSDEEEIDRSIILQVERVIARYKGALDSESQSEDEDLLPIADRHRSLLSSGAASPSNIGSVIAGPSALSSVDQELAECEAEMKKLEQEVRLLRQEVSLSDRGGGGMAASDMEAQTAPQYPPLSGIPEGESLISDESFTINESAAVASQGRESKKEINLLQQQVKLNQALTGITFTSTSWKVVHRDGHVLHREHSHIGTIDNLSFNVQFTVLEKRSSVDHHQNKAVISQLDIRVDPVVYDELSSFIDKVCQNCELMTFYRAFSQYALMHSERHRTLSNAKRDFPDMVYLPNGASSGRINLMIGGGPHFFITWSMAVCDGGNVEEALTVQMKTPRNMSVSHESSSLNQVPSLVERMADKYGCQTALGKLLSAFQTRQ